MKRWILALWFGMAVLHAQAADTTAPPTREQLEQAKAAVEQRFRQAQADCAGRFQVTDCLNQARAERRAALAPLQRQQLQWDDARRRERAAERRQALQQRAAEAAKSASGPGTPRAAQSRQGRAASAATAPAMPGPSRAATAPVATASAAKVNPADDKARDHRAQALKRQQQQQAHQQALAERNAAQDAKRPPKPSLPVPASVVR